MRLFRYRYFWLISALLFGTMACQLLSGINQTRDTVEAAATQARQSLDRVGTARAIITQVGGSDMLKTAQAVATEIGESGWLETAQAVATQEGPGLIETARAVATEKGPGLEQTAQSIFERPPEDIPVMGGEKDNYLAREFLVSYIVPVSFGDVVDFYQREMPANGWDEVEQSTFESERVAVFNYQKGARSAEVFISVDSINRKTTVVVLIAEE